MRQYYFNEKLFRQLTEVLDTSVKNLSKSAGVAQQCWRRWRTNGDIPIRSLIRVCDEYQMPISHFVCIDEDPSLMMGRRHYSLTEGGYEHPQFKHLEWGDEVTTVCSRPVITLCSLCHFSANTFYENFRRKDGYSDYLMMGQWIEYCNKTQVYPLDFFTGKHRDVPVLEGYSRISDSDEQKELLYFKRNKEIAAKNMRLQNLLNKQNERLKEMERELLELRAQVAQLRSSMINPGEGEGMA